MIATGSIWGIPAAASGSRPPPARVEVAVVGGGITGVAILGWLQRRRVDAILLERDHLAAGASGRNAGFLLAGVAENYARAAATYGRSVAAEVWAFTLENHGMVVDHATGIDAGHRRTGSWTAALDVEEAASLEEAATMLAEDRLPGRLVHDPAHAGAMLVLENPADGEIDPVRLVHGLAAPMRQAIFEGTDVVAVDDGSNHATVHLHGGASIEAAAVVLATNAWTAQLWPSCPIRPVRAQMLATAPAPPRLAQPVYAEWGHRYWRQRVDGCVLVGGFRHHALAEEVGHELAVTPTVQSLLEAQLTELGIGAAITHRWAGTMGFSSDGLPMAGLLPGARRIHVCAGYTGHGMGFAVNAARVLTAGLIDSDALPAWLDVRRPSLGSPATPAASR